jgi:hypothetical protein
MRVGLGHVAAVEGRGDAKEARVGAEVGDVAIPENAVVGIGLLVAMKDITGHKVEALVVIAVNEIPIEGGGHITVVVGTGRTEDEVNNVIIW